MMVQENQEKKRFFLYLWDIHKEDILNIIIDFLMVDWFQVYCVVFPFKEKYVFHVNLYICVCDQYFSLVIIIFEDWLKFNWFSEFTLGTEQHNGQSIVRQLQWNTLNTRQVQVDNFIMYLSKL